MDGTVVRRGVPADFERAVEVWRAANEARRGGPASPEHDGRVRTYVQNPTAFLFVAPDRWEEGFGGELVDAVLAEARSRGYGRAQLWTNARNARAHRLYERRGFRRTGREGRDDFGETIVHYARGL